MAMTTVASELLLKASQWFLPSILWDFAYVHEKSFHGNGTGWGWRWGSAEGEIRRIPLCPRTRALECTEHRRYRRCALDTSRANVPLFIIYVPIIFTCTEGPLRSMFMVHNALHKLHKVPSTHDGSAGLEELCPCILNPRWRREQAGPHGVVWQLPHGKLQLSVRDGPTRYETKGQLARVWGFDVSSSISQHLSLYQRLIWPSKEVPSLSFSLQTV